MLREMRFYVFCNSSAKQQQRQQQQQQRRQQQQQNNLWLRPFHDMFRAQHMPEIIISIYVHVYMFSQANRQANIWVRARFPVSRSNEWDSRFRIAYCTRSFSFDALTLFGTGRFNCGTVAIIASLECSISIHFTECIGTLLTKLIRTFVQLILFLRVANQLHIVFDKQMKRAPNKFGALREINALDFGQMAWIHTFHARIMSCQNVMDEIYLRRSKNFNILVYWFNIWKRKCHLTD